MILVAGGTGRLGTLLVRRLCVRGEDVRVLTRDPSRSGTPPRPRCRGAHRRRPPGRHPAGCDVRRRDGRVGGAGIRWSGWGVARHRSMPRRQRATSSMRAARGRRIVRARVDRRGLAADSPRWSSSRMKHAAEGLRRREPYRCRATVVRSTAFAHLWIDLLRKTATRSGRPVVFGRGDNPINMVAADDLAAVVDEVLKDPPAPQSIIEVQARAGRRDVQRPRLRPVQAADGANLRALATSQSPALRVLAASVGRLKPELGRQMRAAVAMDRIELTWSATHDPATEPRLGTTPDDRAARARWRPDRERCHSAARGSSSSPMELAVAVGDDPLADPLGAPRAVEPPEQGGALVDGGDDGQPLRCEVQRAMALVVRPRVGRRDDRHVPDEAEPDGERAASRVDHRVAQDHGAGRRAGDDRTVLVARQERVPQRRVLQHRAQVHR